MQTNDTKANGEDFPTYFSRTVQQNSIYTTAQTAPGEPAPVQHTAHSAVCAALSAMAAFISAASQAAVDLRELESGFAS